jgi:hypothetical protein
MSYSNKYSIRWCLDDSSEARESNLYATFSPFGGGFEQQLPKPGTPAAELTTAERVALCLASGVELECTALDDTGGNFAAWRTLYPVAIVDRGDGGYIVAERKPPSPPPER